MAEKLLSSTKEVREIVKACRKAGIRVYRHKGHIKIYPIDSDMIVISTTPRSIDSLKEAIKQLQSLGVDISDIF